MGVEVRELIIRATVSQEGKASPVPAQGAPDNNQEIIKICVEKILEIIKDKHGR